MEHLPEAIEGARQDVAPCVNRVPHAGGRFFSPEDGDAGRCRQQDEIAGTDSEGQCRCGDQPVV
ncbi:hypothetical protein [Victivallis sp. Marseille-Q1083]|uniref:hypothetical protein n=1 Tax=Victivallis sp. Marseille-Q1083 TaxID=2717288 RepID=UPI00158E8E06|nr:hypothetical protein [Victivallis sp. Marseille-Q1083]